MLKNVSMRVGQEVRIGFGARQTGERNGKQRRIFVPNHSTTSSCCCPSHLVRQMRAITFGVHLLQHASSRFIKPALGCFKKGFLVSLTCAADETEFPIL